jgi:hypothetical protein
MFRNIKVLDNTKYFILLKMYKKKSDQVGNRSAAQVQLI